MAKKFKVKRIEKYSVKEYIVIVDDEDAHWLRSTIWSVLGGDASINKPPYIGRHLPMGGKESFHCMIVGATQGEKVYHINGNTLDNRKENLFKSSDRIEEIE